MTKQTSNFGKWFHYGDLPFAVANIYRDMKIVTQLRVETYD